MKIYHLRFSLNEEGKIYKTPVKRNFLLIKSFLHSLEIETGEFITEDLSVEDFSNEEAENNGAEIWNNER